MTKELSIASVTLAYNAARLLPKQIDALLRQSRPLDEIMVVNNGSTDGTLGVLSAKYPQVKVLDLPANIGAGGGYAAGLAYAAIEKKHDWVWLLDHDSIPMDDGLETLLQGLAKFEGSTESIGMLAPIAIHPGTHLAYPGMLWQRGWVRPRSGLSGQSLCFVDAVISSGSLVRREVVDKVGLPRADFFIDFVDFEYCLRIRRHSYKIAMVRDSHLDHAIGKPRTISILGYSKAWGGHAPWREYYMSRNETFTIWTYYPDWKSKLSIFRRLLRHGTAILAFGEQKRACLRMMLVGFLDGRDGRLGIRFVPDEQNGAHTISADPLLVTKSAPE
ncbi:MAG TPA: glycosyltransferase [Verrucomicrobiae bacterium]|nr:glycosyltransferase [Verrucomicrobiae bacterium]